MSGNEKQIDLIEEKLPIGKNLIFALQHVLVMVAGAVTVPVIIGNSAGLDDSVITFLISCALFAAGVATFFQTKGFKNFLGAKIPVVEGTSFAAVVTMSTIASGAAQGGSSTEGLQIIAGGVIAAGLFCFLMAGVWGKLLKFFPKVVTGTVVTIIGLSLFPVAIKWIATDTVTNKILPEAPVQNIILALITLVLILLFNKFLKGILGNLSILLGLGAGTIVAMLMGMANFSTVTSAETPFFRIVTPFYFGLPKFEVGAIFSFILVMLVIMTEATGNMIAVHNMAGREVEEETLKKGLRSSGLFTMVSGCFNSYPVTAFAQNVGMLSLTGVYSRYISITASIMLIVLAFFPKFGALFAAIPKPVLGGAGFAMFGVVAVGGIRSLGKVNYDGNKNAILVAVSIGLSLIPTACPQFFNLLPKAVGEILHSGITIGCVSAILLNIFFNILFKPKEKNVEAQVNSNKKTGVSH
nr:nucleobase:cation symporter-2 family protein [uncultured Niameybacter sp.]